MAGYLSDFDDVDDDFEYNGRSYREIPKPGNYFTVAAFTPE